MLLVSSVIASVLTFIYVKLAFAVIGSRRQNKVALGSGGKEDLERAIRAHGNFAEYVPLGLILLGALELNGAPWWLVAILGLTLTAGRVIHAEGIRTPPPEFKKRVLGMQITFGTLITLAVLNISWVAYRLWLLQTPT